MLLCIVGCLIAPLTHTSRTRPLVVTTKNVLRHCRTSPGVEAKSPPAESHWSTLYNLYRFSSWSKIFLPRKPDSRPQRVLPFPSVGCNLRAVDTDHSSFNNCELISISLLFSLVLNIFTLGTWQTVVSNECFEALEEVDVGPQQICFL